MELLAPAGNMEKLKAALHFGADAVYLAGQNFGLRAMADNFSEAELAEAVSLVHGVFKKIYITVNILANNSDFEKLPAYLKYLEKIGIDAVIVSDLGIMSCVRKHTSLPIHVSTQANITNKYAAEEFVHLGASRLILARELSLAEIKEIYDHVGSRAEIECFVHGAMCISYSGRCLLSNYFVGRESNKGACVQCCRWGYKLIEEKRPNEPIEVQEDGRGTYFLNSKDLNMISYLKELQAAGVTSLKIEGRMKSTYYVAGVINAYRRALNALNAGKSLPKQLKDEELSKISHRHYTTAYMLNKNNRDTEETNHYGQFQTHEFVAVILSQKGKQTQIEQRNAFSVGDELEILSPGNSFNKTFVVAELTNEKGENIQKANRVQEKLFLTCPYKLLPGDILRKKI